MLNQYITETQYRDMKCPVCGSFKKYDNLNGVLYRYCPTHCLPPERC